MNEDYPLEGISAELNKSAPCQKCHCRINKKFHYCPHCGTKVSRSDLDELENYLLVHMLRYKAQAEKRPKYRDTAHKWKRWYEAFMKNKKVT